MINKDVLMLISKNIHRYRTSHITKEYRSKFKDVFGDILMYNNEVRFLNSKCLTMKIGYRYIFRFKTCHKVGNLPEKY